MNKIFYFPNSLFNRTFSDPQNIAVFLDYVLPPMVRDVLDLSSIEIDLTNHVVAELRENFTDIIARTSIQDNSDSQGDEEKKIHSPRVDIYILFTHEPVEDNKVFVQFFKYMYTMWQEDLSLDRPLRLIIPLVFYYGEEPWTTPTSFALRFPFPGQLQGFLMDYGYVLFNALEVDFIQKENQRLKDNVFHLTALILLKNGFRRDMDAVEEIFRFWENKGFSRETVKMIFFLSHLSASHRIYPETFKMLIDDSKTDGGRIIPELAKRWVSRGKKEGVKKGIKEGKKETARRMLMDGLSVAQVIKYTDLPDFEIEGLWQT